MNRKLHRAFLLQSLFGAHYLYQCDKLGAIIDSGLEEPCECDALCIEADLPEIASRIIESHLAEVYRMLEVHFDRMGDGWEKTSSLSLDPKVSFKVSTRGGLSVGTESSVEAPFGLIGNEGGIGHRKVALSTLFPRENFPGNTGKAPAERSRDEDSDYDSVMDDG